MHLATIDQGVFLETTFFAGGGGWGWEGRNSVNNQICTSCLVDLVDYLKLCWLRAIFGEGGEGGEGGGKMPLLPLPKILIDALLCPCTPCMLCQYTLL